MLWQTQKFIQLNLLGAFCQKPRDNVGTAPLLSGRTPVDRQGDDNERIVWKRRVIGGQNKAVEVNESGVFWLGFYLLCFGLLEGELHGRHSQLVGEEIHISRQLQGADVGSGAVSTSNAAQQLSLTERRGDEGKDKLETHLLVGGKRRETGISRAKATEVNKMLPC